VVAADLAAVGSLDGIPEASAARLEGERVARRGRLFTALVAASARIGVTAARIEAAARILPAAAAAAERAGHFVDRGALDRGASAPCDQHQHRRRYEN